MEAHDVVQKYMYVHVHFQSRPEIQGIRVNLVFGIDKQESVTIAHLLRVRDIGDRKSFVQVT